MRRMRRRLLFLLALATPWPSAPAQARSSGDAFTLGDALSLVRATHPALEAASGRAQIAIGRARQDAAFANPSVEWRRENLSSALSPDVFAVVTLPLDLTGRRLAQRSAGRRLVARATAESSATAHQLDADVARAYWRAVLAGVVRDAAREQQDALTQLASFDSTRWREGAVAEGTAMRTRLEAERARLGLSTLAADAERAHAELARVLGADPARVPWPSAALECETLPERGAIASIDSLAELALARRAEVAAARERLAETRQRVRAEQRGVLGDVALSGGTKQTAGLRTLVVGVIVPLPIVDRNRGNVERAAGEVLVAEAERRETEARVRAEVVAAARALDALLAARAEAAPSGLVARADPVLGVARAAYREGATSLLELLDAQGAALDVRVATARWMADLLIARAELARALGEPIPER
jgi:cobalt-zinc-cadmium efflux system outer membrane protein